MLAATVDFERFRPILETAAAPLRREGRPYGAGRGSEIQDAGSAEPPRAVAGGDGDGGARPADQAALLRP